MILDDCFLGKQSKAAAYYTIGRHNNCDTLYISKYYFALSRQSVRENSNFIILFPQNTKSVEHTIEITVQIYPLKSSVLFKEFCQTVWEGKHNFITIDLTSNCCNGQYRKNLDTSYIPKAFKDQDSSLYYPNLNTFKCDMSLSNSIGSVLGFDKKIWTEKFNTSEHTVNIMRVNSILVFYDLIGSSYLNSTQQPISLGRRLLCDLLYQYTSP